MKSRGLTSVVLAVLVAVPFAGLEVMVTARAASADPVVTTFNYTGTVQTYVVPAGVTYAVVEAWGAQGGKWINGLSGGLGGHVKATVPVTPGESLAVRVGGAGTSNSGGGFNGGGSGGIDAASAPGGGGASDVRQGGDALTDRVIVAGGGGGEGVHCEDGCTYTAAGVGGGATGGSGADGGGAGGTATSGYALGMGGDGVPGSITGGCLGAGGGGGFWGGFGGEGDCFDHLQVQTPGGGGSGYVTPSAVAVLNQSGRRAGNGLVTITAGASCNNTMNPANNGNASGLVIACTFASGADAGTSLIIDDYKDAVWHAGNARQVTVTVNRSVGPDPETGNLVLKWAGGAGLEQGPVASDVNHSIENLTSTVYDIQTISPLGAFIDAGTTIRAVDVANKLWILSKPTIDGRDNKPLCPGNTDTTCATSLGIVLTIANNVGRQGNNGATTANSATVTSANTIPTACAATTARPGCTSVGTANTAAAQGMHFCAPALGSECASTDDRGNFLSGGDLPDGAQIDTVASRTSVTLDCDPTVGGSVGGAPSWNWGDGDPCVTPFVGTVTSASGLVFDITPYPIPTSTRFISGATFTGTKATNDRTITMASDTFSKFDVGMLVRGCDTSSVVGSVCATPTGVETGTRIASVSAGGTTAVMDTASGSGGSAWSSGGGQHVTIGIQTKTAPATGDVIGSLAINLIVNPDISPTSPPCAANKVSGFQLPIKWRNPGPMTPYVAGTTPAGYDWGFNGASNHFAGASITGSSTGQLTVLTSVTTFAGFLRQNITVASTVPTTTRWRIHFESLPIGIGLCPGSGIAETLEVKGLSNKHAMNPSGTGGAYGAVRALLPEGQNQSGGSTYTGTSGNLAGATVTAGASHTETNTCTVTSPNVLRIGCPEHHTL